MMCISDFLWRQNAVPEQICAEDCLSALLQDMERGLSGQGNIPMLPSYLPAQIPITPGSRCCVLDAGGTNLRTALAVFDENGSCRLEGLQKIAMPGTEGEVSYEDFYSKLAAPLRTLGSFDRVGFCFSFNVTLGRSLDGKLDFWCKEIQVPEAVGKPVGSSLKAALGAGCSHVHVLNDSVAAMLGAGDPQTPIQVGIILGTGVNVCYLEDCRRIVKITEALNSNSMVISTEVGEFDKIPKSTFEQAVIAESDAPDNAHGEKQCSGGYLGDILCKAWQAAAAEGLLPESFRDAHWSLAEISSYLAGDATSIPCSAEAAALTSRLIHRAAKIAAILCAGPMILAAEPGQRLQVAMEGSQYWKLTGFREYFHQELDRLMEDRGIQYQIIKSKNACLVGAARAAFAQVM